MSKVVDAWLLSSAAAARCRSRAGVERCPVLIVPGTRAPHSCGERAYHTFRGSDTVVEYPGSALRAGKKLDYHASTFRVEVGRAWLLVERLPQIVAKLPRSVKRWNDGVVLKLVAAICGRQGGVNLETWRRYSLIGILHDAMLEADSDDERLLEALMLCHNHKDAQPPSDDFVEAAREECLRLELAALAQPREVPA